ncbi:Histidinol-phosphatase [Chitinispirillum alkaliphilum]|nr:Histidinol-phosphatase [Chitinispirillum alkaliphilum]
MYESELAVALRAAEEAGRIQLESAQKIGTVQLKSDDSPVTEIDKLCEQRISEILINEFQDDGFLREESSQIRGTSGRRWIIDPLDGTRPFIRGIPTHSVLIALEYQKQPVLGVIYLPALNQLCFGSAGNGAFLNGKQIYVSHTDKVTRAMGSALGYVENSDNSEGRALLNLMKKWDYGYGFMDSFTYVCVASGKIDVSVSLLDKAWDCAAAACIIKEAGGTFSDINGEESVHNGSIVFSNGIIHKEVLRVFREDQGKA